MNKKLIRLTESDLHRIVKESVNKVLKEDTSSMQIGMQTQRRASELANVLGPELINLFHKADCALQDSFLTEQEKGWDYDEDLTDEQYEALNIIARFFFELRMKLR